MKKSQFPSPTIIVGFLVSVVICVAAAGSTFRNVSASTTEQTTTTHLPITTTNVPVDSVGGEAGEDEVTQFLGTLDADIFGTSHLSHEKYKRAVSELDALLGSLIAEIKEKQDSVNKFALKKRNKREIGGGYGGGGGGYGGGGNSYGGGGGNYGGGDDGGHYGWGQQQESYGGGGGGGGGGGWHHQPVHIQHVPVPHYKVHHHHHGINPEFLLKTALILKGILVLGHVAAMG